MNTLKVVEVDSVKYEEIINSSNINIPIEQSVVWNNFSSSCGNYLFKYLVVFDQQLPIATLSLYKYKLYSFEYLWAKNGPVFLKDSYRNYEEDICNTLREYVRHNFPKIVLLRLNIEKENKFTRPVMRVIPYDSTVIMDISGSDEDILSRMKPRGRRDVRKSLRESGMQCSEESSTILNNFDEVYEIMKETANRDSFVPHEIDFYKKMLKSLGNNCKFFVGRIDGKVVCWNITTVYGNTAVQYYAATNKLARDKYCYDHLVYFTACYLRDMGIKYFDLMGIGSDFSPSLLGLNMFKTKFSKEIKFVPPIRDLVCNSFLYTVMLIGYRGKRFIRKFLKH